MDVDQRKMLAALKLVYFAQSRLLSYFGYAFLRSVSLDPAVDPIPTGFDTQSWQSALRLSFAGSVTVDRPIMFKFCANWWQVHFAHQCGGRSKLLPAFAS